MVYLNNAATSWPKAPGVAEAVRQALETPAVEPGRGGARGPDPVRVCREGLARLLGVPDPARIVFTASATASLNAALEGLRLAPGSLVVTTAAEHNSVLRPLERLRRKCGVTVEIVPLTPDGELDEEMLDRVVERGPRLVAITHASNVTGRVYPVARWFAKARAAGALTLLDASQSLGYAGVRPLQLGADLVAFTGHKGLLGPAGTGGLWVSPGLELGHWMVGGTGTRSDLVSHPEEMPARMEAGTPNLPGLAGLAAAVGWLERHGEGWRAGARRMEEALRGELGALRGVRILGGGGPERAAALSFRIAGWSVEEAGHALEASFGVACRAGLHCAPLIHRWIGSAPEGTIRFSVSGFTTPEDVRAAAAAVRELARCA